MNFNNWPELPVRAVLPRLAEALSSQRAAVLHAPPGAGKTTLVPVALHDAPWLVGQSILVLEPRRLAARASAARLAELRGETVGASVGYRVRFEQRVSHLTRIEVLTEGILIRRLQGDPALSGVGLVIFDEFHERSLDADLALALCLDVARSLRPDLRLVVMSATLEVERVAGLLRRCGLGGAVISAPGRAFPVTLHYLPRDPEGDPAHYVAAAVQRALAAHSGDVLAFLPGAGEIRRAHALLTQSTPEARVVFQMLYGDLPQEAQDQALRPDPQGRRKVVLATPIAETSLTIAGITVVVDSGLARVPRFDPGYGLTHLETVRITHGSATQRAGRAGRLTPGDCYRLWSAATQQSLATHAAPEIRSADLAGLALELAQWGVEPSALEWLDPPPAGAFAQARALLQALNAVDDAGRLTALGRALGAVPLHPRLAHLLHEAHRIGQGGWAADVAALLSERDVLRAAAGTERSCDLGLRLEALAAFRRGGAAAARAHGADPGACAQVETAARQLRALIKVNPPSDLALPHELGRLLAWAYPDRVAGQRAAAPGRYVLASGRGVRLPPGDALGRDTFLVAAHLDAGRTEGIVHLAAPITREDLRAVLAAQIQTVDRLEWNEEIGAVSARQEEKLGELLLESRPLARPDPEAIRAVVLDGIRTLEVLPWTPELREWQARIVALRVWRPEENWPEVSDQALLKALPTWLGPFLNGVTRREHLAQVNLAAALAGYLTWEQTRDLEILAPTHLIVPSGSRLRLNYTSDAVPVLAVKLQELFGLGATPRIAGGRVAVTLQLLSPARRPLQVTQDLRGFWERTYPQIRKELQGRYPKHPWPANPWTAAPTARAKPRGK